MPTYLCPTISVLIVMNGILCFGFYDPVHKYIPFDIRAGLVTFVLVAYLAFVAGYRQITVRYGWVISRLNRMKRWHKHLIIWPTVFFLLVLLRPRLNWGDSIWTLMMVKEGILASNSRWLVGATILTAFYEPFRGLLFPRTFITLFHCLLGVISIGLTNYLFSLMLLNLRQKVFAFALIFSSYGTLALWSGYIEIYPIAQFGLVLFTIVSVLIFYKSQIYWNLIFGITVGAVSLLYMGLIPLMLLGLIPLFYNICKFRNKIAVRIVMGMVGLVFGLYFMSWALSCKVILDPYEAFLQIRQSVFPLTDISLVENPNSWYYSKQELFSTKRLLEYLDTWMIYGFGGFLLILHVLLSNAGEKSKRNFIYVLKDGPLLILIATCATYLFFMYLKRFVLAFQDWDLFSYIVYPVNILAIYIWVNYQPINKDIQESCRFIIHCAAICLVFVFLIMNPLDRELNIFPSAKCPPHIMNFSLFEKTRITPLMETVAADIKRSQKR